MGNICSKSANKDDNFAGPGRVLGTSADAPQRSTAPLPAQAKKAAQSTPGQALGSRGDDTNAPRSAAAKAAEERALAANKTGGKLSSQLAAQKKQTQNQTLSAGSEAERLARAADENAQNRNWN